MYKIILLPGDGIGIEVTKSALSVMKTVAELFNVELEFEKHLIGGSSYDAYGEPLTKETLQACYNSDAVFLGAVGGYKWESLPHNLKPEAALLKLRKALGLFTNIRPAKIYKPLIDSSSLKKEVLSGVDFLVLRELTGGIYFGEPREFDANHGLNTMVYFKDEVERIAHMAFKIARERNNKVTSVDKANVLEVSQFWRNVVHQVHKEYEDVLLNDLYVDNAAMQIVHNPKQFDVILTSNLFGDILSDIAGMITGSLGMLPSASLGNKYALYEPVHGSAPDIAGQNKANPLAAIASVAMMFDYSFEMKKAASLINEAIVKTLEDGYRTVDIQSEGCKIVSTEKMTQIVITNFKELYHNQAIGLFTL
ncbi:MAG: 3-isopropylmalate dehydrogenase [Bacteroidetes bacterium]|nr:3-isopropylmalate dehydrogenase [Bacteroidota bacterium]MBU1677385.1 3-isopropylmalate dehydrogenase [Bacteroidota bacterium]MBU2508324.1 3-isopropylmalate dehydrogenase [Bacteroidota bacterium]